MKDEKYLIMLNQALLSFQMIEEAMKICIGLSYEAIAASLPSGLYFKFSPDSIDNAPLGKLISMFSNISKNGVLIEDLKKVVKWRNFCAHNAFTHEYLNRSSKSSFSEHSAGDIENVILFSSNILLRLGDEIKKIREIHSELI